jgi:hypothetical protein
MCAWLIPLLVGSVTTHRHQDTPYAFLESWVRCVWACPQMLRRGRHSSFEDAAEVGGGAAGDAGHFVERQVGSSVDAWGSRKWTG